MAPKKPSEMTEEDMTQFDWITLQKDMDKVMPLETFTSRFMRKFKESPFVPIGAFATTCALSYGLWCFKTGQTQKSQYMMRTRIFAQGATVVALVAGIFGTTKAIK